MSDDEVFPLLISHAFAVWFILRWYGPVLMVAGHGTGGGRWPIALAPLIAAMGLFMLLRTWASFDVRDSSTYLFYYMSMGAGWLGFASLFFAQFGLHVRDDAIERDNPAAAWAAAGAVVGITACYAGANIGDGPGWWCVIYAGGLAQLTWFAAWLVLEIAAKPVESVTIDRDFASGLRLAGFLIAVGVIAGRAAAGDWTSAEQTLREFTVAWPILPLLVVAIAIERQLRPSPRRPKGDILLHGSLVALFYIAFAVATVVGLGPPPHGTFHQPAVEQ